MSTQEGAAAPIGPSLVTVGPQEDTAASVGHQTRRWLKAIETPSISLKYPPPPNQEKNF